MSLAIHIENLGKKYRVNHARERAEYHTIREAIMQVAAAPWRRLREGPLGCCEDFWALRDINFDVKHGEVMGIIGRNGAGKSTLLKILSRITKPTTGCVKLYGRVASLLEVGTGFHPELTGRENIFLNGSILGMSRAEIQRKFDEIVDFSGIEQFLDTPIKRYSSGMKVRLAFSVAAHLEPEILIIDEVLAVGDIEFQKKCLGKMGDVARSGRTVLFVSHNMMAVHALCESGVVLVDGSKCFEGGAHEAIEKYQSSMKGKVASGQYIAIPSKSKIARISKAIVTCDSRDSIFGYRAGEPLNFEVHCHFAHAVCAPALGIGIDNSMGERVITLHSNMSASRALSTIEPGRIVFSCKMCGVILRPGDYQVKLSFEGNACILDSVSQAFSFSILPTDQYHIIPQTGRGVVLCNQLWEFARCPDFDSLVFQKQ